MKERICITIGKDVSNILKSIKENNKSPINVSEVCNSALIDEIRKKYKNYII